MTTVIVLLWSIAFIIELSNVFNSSCFYFCKHSFIFIFAGVPNLNTVFDKNGRFLFKKKTT